MSNVIVVVSDKNYINHTYSLLGNLKTIGNWKGDIVVIISEDLDIEDYLKLKRNNIIVVKSPMPIYSYFAKLFVFNEFFKKWDKICYLDQDHLVLKDINCLFELDGDFLISRENFKIRQYFKRSPDEKVYSKLEKSFNLDQDGFITSCMIFKSDIIEKNTLSKVFSLIKKYKSINFHCDLPQGSEQPIINLYFYDMFTDLKKVSFIKEMHNESVLVHTTHFFAPWVDPVHREYYGKGLRIFNS